MGIRSTIGTTLDDKDVIIPNSALVKSTVVNYTLRDELVRVRVSVAVRPDADLRRVREVLEATAAAAEWRSRTSDPVVLLADLARTGPVWEVSVFVDDPWRLRTHAARLREAIWWALADAGIELAGPPAPPAPVVPPAGAA
jgi:small-conductance mechanosensitive channel